jgi:D-lactate dehydrogenase (cytochrome)
LSDAEATVVSAGTHALKSSAGYDLVSLMCGSEGTLGVITSVTVKLHSIPEHVVAAVCVFDSLTDATQAVAAIKLAEIPITRCELLDASSVQAFNAYSSSNSSKDGDNTSTSSSTKN